MPFDFVRRSNDDMILCEIQLSYRMFIKTISSLYCASVSLSSSYTIVLSLCHPHLNVHLSLPFFFSFYFFVSHSVARNAFSYANRRSPMYTNCIRSIEDYFVLHRILYFSSCDPAKCLLAIFSISLHSDSLHTTLSLIFFGITLMLMILWVFDKPNDEWKWQYQTWKKSSALPLWLLYAE